LFGISGSPGVADGPARIVHGPDQFGEVLQGDVVIARSTNPVWTQLFNRIAAIVVENGSRLSHAAIVAREVGIPAVVGILGVLDIVRDGEQLRVDGTAGEVIRLDSKKEA
jgi:pyruvate,water dikinase